MVTVILITVWVVLLFVLAQIIEPGVLFGRLYFFDGEVLGKHEYDKLPLVFHLFGNGNRKKMAAAVGWCQKSLSQPPSICFYDPN